MFSINVRWLAVFRNTKRSLRKVALLIIYRSLIESHLPHDITISGNCEETLLLRLQSIQSKALLIMTVSNCDAPSEPLLRDLGWKTLRELHTNDIDTSVYKAIDNSTLGYLNETLTPMRQCHYNVQLRSTQTDFSSL